MSDLHLAAPTSNAGRKALSKKGQTAYGTSYPVPNASYYHKAVQAIGRAPASKRGVLKSFLRKRAKQLGIKPSPAVASGYSNEMTMATPAVGASDGPRVMKSSAISGLQPHQARAYLRFRRRGANHRAAMTFARRVRSRANEMGSAAGVGSGTGSKAYANENMDLAAFRMDTPASNAKGSQLTAAARASRASTVQKSQFVPQYTPGKVRSGGSEGNPRGVKTTPSRVPGIRSSSATPPGGKLLRQSGGRYSWPDNKGAGKVPRTHVGTGQDFKTPTNLVVKSLVNEPGMSKSVRVSAVDGQAKQAVSHNKQKIAYGRLRGIGISHATAMKVVGQYYGSGKPRNQLGLNKGGSQTNLRMRQGAAGSVSRRPKG